MTSDQGEGAARALHHQAGQETPGRRGETALQRPPDALATTATTRTSNGDSDQDIRRRLERIAAAAAVTGGPLFLLGTVLHAKRDGWSIAAAGQAYGITHGLQAVALLLLTVSLASAYAANAGRFGRRGLPAFLLAVVGTMLWFGLIVFDGSRNPVTAKYAPEIVHTPADIDVVTGIVVLPALLVFPVGYMLLARVLSRTGMTWPGLLIGVGAMVYWAAFIPLFAFGPESPVVQTLEVIGAVPYAVGFVLIGVRRAPKGVPSSR